MVPQRSTAIVLALATLGAGAAVAFGAPTWLILIAAAFPWLLILISRCPIAAGVATLAVLELWALMMVLMVTAALRLPMVPVVIVVWTLLGIAGSVVLLRLTVPRRRPSAASVSMVTGSLVGGLVWLATQGLAAIVPGASRVSWIMRGDSANNLLFARQIVYDSGIQVGPGENPVPLPAALIAVVMDAGRGGIAPENLARHDLGSFAQVWSLSIIVTCVLAGLAAGAIARHATHSRVVLGIASTVGSLVPLSWFVTGYSLEFGFFSTHAALPIVFAAIILFLSLPRHPAIALGLLTAAATLLLAVWSPLVMVPAVLGAMLVLSHGRRILATRGWSLAVLVVGAAQLLAYGLVVVVPSVLQNAGSLAASGGLIEFPKLGIVAVVLTAGLLGSSVLAFRGVRHPVPLATIGVVVALAAAIAALVFAGRASADPWGYYPMKLLWMSSTILIVLLVGSAAAVLARVASRPWLERSGLTVIAAGLVAVLVYAPAPSPTLHLNPVDQVLSGRSLGPADQVAERVSALADARRSHFLWNSGDEFEQQVNLWVVQLWADTLQGNFDLRYAAYGLYDHNDVTELCRIVGLLGGDTIVHTAETDLAARVAQTCPGEGISVELG